jgi:hypothetical protein
MQDYARSLALHAQALVASSSLLRELADTNGRSTPLHRTHLPTAASSARHSERSV